VQRSLAARGLPIVDGGCRAHHDPRRGVERPALEVLAEPDAGGRAPAATEEAGAVGGEIAAAAGARAGRDGNAEDERRRARLHGGQGIRRRW
jgi:hypothetical protein